MIIITLILLALTVIAGIFVNLADMLGEPILKLRIAFWSFLLLTCGSFWITAIEFVLN